MFGVPADALALYEELVARSEASVGSESDDLRPDDPRLHYLTEHALGFMTAAMPGRVFPVAPLTALTPIVGDLEAAVLDQPELLRTLWALMTRLQQRFIQLKRLNNR